ncbi:MAG: hypothetical protein QXH80_02575 [Candidatus Nanoarchaeia archaeon]
MATKKQVFRCGECGKESDVPGTHHNMPMEAQQPYEEERVEYECGKCGYRSATQIKHCGKMMKLVKKPK